MDLGGKILNEAVATNCRSRAWLCYNSAAVHQAYKVRAACIDRKYAFIGVRVNNNGLP